MHAKYFILILVLLVATKLQAQPYCGLIESADGSRYSLAPFIDKKFYIMWTDPNFKTRYFNYVICGNQLCSSKYAAACDTTSDQFSSNGKFDVATSIEALDKNQGVVITYNNGDECSYCTPRARRATVLNLLCNDTVPYGQTNFISIDTDGEGLPPITSITAAINCTIPTRDKVLRVDYYSYSPSCNGSSPSHKIEIQKTQFCYEGCTTMDEQYIYTTCGKPMKMNIQNATWVQTVLFDDDQCITVTKQVLQKNDACIGDFSYSYQDCNDTSVKEYDCKFNPYCENCQVTNSYPTNQCVGKKQYYCLSKH